MPIKKAQILQRPSGFHYFPNFLSIEEEQKLLLHLPELTWEDVKMYGVVAKRKVIHFGFDYSFQTRSIQPTISPPEFLSFIILRALPVLNINELEPLEVLASFYPDGAGIGWHTLCASDSETKLR